MAKQDSPSSTDIDPQTVEEAKKMWGAFTVTTKYTVLAIVALLLLMAFFLV